MNHRTEVFDVEAEARQVEEIVACIINTVIFHRCKGKYTYTKDNQYSEGTVGFMDVACETFNMTYCRVTSDELQATINEQIKAFSESFRAQSRPRNSGQLSLEFYQKKRGYWIFSGSSAPWEIWTIQVTIVRPENDRERIKQRELVTEWMQKQILHIAQLINKYDYVPEIPERKDLDLVFDTHYTDVTPYLFRIRDGGAKTAPLAPAREFIKDTLTK